MKPLRVVLADDHVLFRHGLKKILSQHGRVEVVGEAGNGLELLHLLNKVRPDLIILDISMPQLRGIEAISEIKKIHADAGILILTMHSEPDYIIQGVTAGADGYLLKEDAERDLFSAIDVVAGGGIYLSHLVSAETLRDWAQIRRGERSTKETDQLTVREREILKLIAEGRTSKEIGDLLSISFRTVERHRANMMEKLGVNKTADLVRLAIKKGLT
jgi:DNA-binding NarL/FixJ family response regulator